MSDDAQMAALVGAVRAALREAADPSRAPGMQAYMKSTQPYLGVRVPDVRRLTRAAARTHPPASATDAGAAAAALWRAAEFREERYAAQALTGLPVARGELHLLPLLEEMITTGAWWDFVDEAAHRIGELLRADPADDDAGPPRRGPAPRTAGCAGPRSSPSSGSRSAPTSSCSPTWCWPTPPTRTSSSGRRSAGRCATTPAPRPTGCAAFVRAHPLSPLSRREATKHLR